MKNRFMNYIKGGLHRRIIMKDNKINTNMSYYHYSFVYKKRGFSKINALDLSFLFIFISRWITSNKFELIHHYKNMKSTTTLSITVKLKVTTAFCILINSAID